MDEQLCEGDAQELFSNNRISFKNNSIKSQMTDKNKVMSKVKKEN